MILKIGGELYANEFGGYVSGYVDVARKTYLMDGVKWDKNELDAKTAAKLLYNSLFVSVTGLDYVSDKGIHIEVKHGKNFLNDKLDIYLMEAILINDGIRSYDNSGVNENYIVLKNTTTGEEITVYNKDASVTD